jgi:hypothetical protein
MSFKVKLNYHNLPPGVDPRAVDPQQLALATADAAAEASARTAGVPDLVYHMVESLEVKLPHNMTLRIFETDEDYAIVMEVEGEEPYALETVMKENDAPS